jgi:hypothetical protein
MQVGAIPSPGSRHEMVARARHSITIAKQRFDYVADARPQRRWNPVCKAMSRARRGRSAPSDNSLGCAADVASSIRSYFNATGAKVW